jgi:cytochrome c oxidase subunit 3
VAQGVGSVRAGRPRLSGSLFLAAIGCGVLFLVLKVTEYIEHFHEGLYPGVAFDNRALSTFGTRIFFTLYYLMTGLHALHVIAGIAILTWLMIGCFQRRYSAASPTRVEVGALYWSLVDIVWLFLWTILYLLGSPG